MFSKTDKWSYALHFFLHILGVHLADMSKLTTQSVPSSCGNVTVAVKHSCHYVQQLWLHYQWEWLCVAYIYKHTTPINALQVVWACGIFVAFEEHICCWKIFCSSLVNYCSVLILIARCRILSIYYIVVPCIHEVIGIYGIWGHIWCCKIYGFDKVAVFLLVYAVMWFLHVD